MRPDPHGLATPSHSRVTQRPVLRQTRPASCPRHAEQLSRELSEPLEPARCRDGRPLTSRQLRLLWGGCWAVGCPSEADSDVPTDSPTAARRAQPASRPVCCLTGTPGPQHAYLWVPRKDGTESNGSFPGHGGLASAHDRHPEVNSLLPGARLSLFSELRCLSPQKGVSGCVRGPEGSAMRGSGPGLGSPQRRRWTSLANRPPEATHLPVADDKPTHGARTAPAPACPSNRGPGARPRIPPHHRPCCEHAHFLGVSCPTWLDH